MDIILEVHDLHVCYRKSTGTEIHAAQGISFDVRRGEILGCIGESGAGKSTLAASLLSLLPTNGKILRGTILLEGRNLLNMASRELREVRGGRIGLIFQEPSLALHPTMRIGDQVTEVLRAHFPLENKQRRERVAEALTAVFGSDAHRISSCYPHELSGGQRQRAVIAQAIACRPSVIVADEPTASLDTVTQREILSLFQKLRGELGIAIVFITHNPALLAGFADRILVLYGGRVAELGSTADLLSSPLHPYTRMLLQCAPALNDAIAQRQGAKLPVIPGEPLDLSTCAPGCNFAARCPEKMEICGQRPPSRVQKGDAHEVSCFLYGG